MLIEISFLLAAALSVDPPNAFVLPQKRDIPANFSTVICTDETKARTFINEYISTNSSGTGINLGDFFRGLEATGCRQASGPLQIEEVLVRKSVVHGQTLGQILYLAKRPSGEIVFGIVDEIANNRFPRTAFEEWTSEHTEDGVLTANIGDRRTYVCRSPQAARVAVASLSRVKQSNLGDSRLRTAKAKTLRASGCVEARARFQVRSVHSSVAIFFGNDSESMEEWTALTAVSTQGQVVGLLHDASLF